MEKKRNNKMIIIILVIIALLVVGVAILLVNAINQDNISKEKALELALSHANVKESAASRIINNLEMDDGISKYEIEFYAGDFEYEYEIDAKKGEVINWSKEKKDSILNNKVDLDPSKYIGEDNAKKAALQSASIENPDYIRVKLEVEDGLVYYDVEFQKDKYEYNYDIDAYSGELLEKDVDKELF